MPLQYQKKETMKINHLGNKKIESLRENGRLIPKYRIRDNTKTLYRKGFYVHKYNCFS